jgi:hypothetical protein
MMGQQNIDIPASGRSGAANGWWGMGAGVTVGLVVANLVITVAIWYFAFPS